MKRRSRWKFAVLTLAAWLPGQAAALPSWTLEIDRLSLGAARLSEVNVSSAVAAGGGEGIRLRVASLIPGEGLSPYGPFSLFCPGELLRIAESLCRSGSWDLALSEGWPDLKGTLIEASIADDATFIDARGTLATLAWLARLESSEGSLKLSLEIPEQEITGLGFLGPSLPALGWLSAGRLGGSAEISGVPGQALNAGGSVEVSGVDFDSPDGVYAGLGVGARLSARLDSGDDGAVILDGRLVTGELLLQDFYRDFSGRALDLAARILVLDELLEVQRMALGDGDALHLAGQARIPLGVESARPELLLRELRLEFPAAYERYLEPLAAVFSLDGLETEGAVSWSGDWSPGTARSGVLRLEELSVRDAKGGRFAIDGFDATLATGSKSRLTWEAAAFEKLDLGAGAATIALSQESLSLLEPLRIGVFDGHLSLEELSIGFPKGGELDIQLQAAIEDIEMQRMSRALDWPEFAGTLSGRIPGINWSGGVIEIEGALDFRVFDGQVMLTDLRVERPFGPLPSLAANITATGLDLEQLTRTFEFGRIAGRIDGYVHDLRMLDWRPVQFDAWFGTPAGAGRQDISRQAVRHLATIGGGSPTALLSGPVLRLFNDFSYRRLGLGCRLQDNVCRIRGIEEQGDAVLLLEGAGIPKISILAYNRAVDWPQLVREMTAVSGGEEVRIGD